MVLAGLVPALAAAPEPRVPGAALERDMRPGDDPLARLEETLARLAGSPGVIVVDQFEEVFTLCRDEDHGAPPSSIGCWRCPQSGQSC